MWLRKCSIDAMEGAAKFGIWKVNVTDLKHHSPLGFPAVYIATLVGRFQICISPICLRKKMAPIQRTSNNPLLCITKIFSLKNCAISSTGRITPLDIKWSTRPQLPTNKPKCWAIWKILTLKLFNHIFWTAALFSWGPHTLNTCRATSCVGNDNSCHRSTFIHWNQQFHLLLLRYISASIFSYEICLLRSSLFAFTLCTGNSESSCILYDHYSIEIKGIILWKT